jgi:hypothetical protein
MAILLLQTTVMMMLMNKRHSFAPMIPGRSDTYVYHTESSYYEQYNQAYYGITMKKAGWDCLRHYEILASGAIPFFLGMEQLIHHEKLLMYIFPKQLVYEAMTLPGVPSERKVLHSIIHHLPLPSIDMKLFNKTKYFEYQQQLLKYAHEKLSTTFLVEYMMKQVQILYQSRRQKQAHDAHDDNFTSKTTTARTRTTQSYDDDHHQFVPRVLFVGHNGGDYLNVMIYHGLRQLFNARFSFLSGISTYKPNTNDDDVRCSRNEVENRMNVLYADDASPYLWGNGYSYHKKLKVPHLYLTSFHRPPSFESGASDGGSNNDCLVHEHSNMMNSLLVKRLSTNYFNVIIFITYGNACCGYKYCFSQEKIALLNEYIVKNREVIVVTVDGNDIMGCHDEFTKFKHSEKNEKNEEEREEEEAKAKGGNMNQDSESDSDSPQDFLPRVDLRFVREVELNMEIPQEWNEGWKLSAMKLKKKIEHVQTPCGI